MTRKFNGQKLDINAFAARRHSRVVSPLSGLATMRYDTMLIKKLSYRWQTARRV